jgi:hypothetical protein
MQFFYDAQIRRFVLQFIRYFTQFQVEYGKDSNGNVIYYTVPVRYADTNRAASSILRNNSENTLNNVPMMVAYIDSLKYHRAHIADPTYVEKLTVRERATDPLTGQLTTYQNNVVTVERHMPVPYRLGLKLDIYTLSMEHKLQLLEQILPMFNPSKEIQNTDNYVDWTSLTYCELTDLNFSSRTIPVGTDDPIDVCSINFEVHLYITSPAKVKKLDAVASVVASVYNANGGYANSILDQLNLLGTRQWFTPSGYNAIVADGKVVLSQQALAGTDTNTGIPVSAGTPVPWRSVISYFGEISNGISQMAFVNGDTGNTVIGTISYDPTDDTVLLFNVDTATIPTNNLLPINNIIDPLTSGPGVNLPAIADMPDNQRYLIINNNIGNLLNADINHPIAWRNADNSPVFANANDIIQYDKTAGVWNKVFDSQNTTTIFNPDTDANEIPYVTNLYNGIQLKWSNQKWQKSWEGLYPEGLWLIII